MKTNYRLILGVIILLGATLRIDGINRGFEYDEIWPLYKYAGKPSPAILFIRDEVNLQPLNNFIYSFYDPDKATEWKLRGWVYLAGCLLILVIAKVTLMVGKSRGCSLLSAFLAALNPALIHYSQTARAYSYQYLFALLLYGLLVANGFRKKHLLLWSLCLLVVSMLLQWTLVTSILVIIPAYAYFLIRSFRDERGRSLNHWPWIKSAVVPIIISSVGIISWLAWVYPGIQEGKRYGTDLGTDPNSVFQAIALVFSGLEPVLLAFAAITAIVCYRHRHCHFTLLLTGMAVAMIPITGAGFSRVYTWLIPFYLILISIGIRRLSRLISQHLNRPKFGAAITVLIVSLLVVHNHIRHRDRWRLQIDYKYLISLIMIEGEAKYYMLFNPIDGYCAYYYYAAPIMQNNSMHMNLPSISKQLLIFNSGKKEITLPAYTPHTSQNVSLNLGPIAPEYFIKRDHVDCCLLPLIKVTDDILKECGLIIAELTIPIEDFQIWQRRVIATPDNKKWHLLNPWLTRAISVSKQGESPERLICVLYVAEVKSKEELVEIIDKLDNPQANFYWIRTND